jgi:hypothetical protein
MISPRSFFTAALIAGTAWCSTASAADLDSDCITLIEAGAAGPGAAESVAYELGRSLLGAEASLIQSGCQSLWCALPGASPEVAEAIRRGVLRSGNDDLAACIVDDIAPVPPPIDASPN